MKRFLLFLAAVSAAVVLTACGTTVNENGGTSTAPSNADVSSAPVSSETEPEHPATLDGLADAMAWRGYVPAGTEENTRKPMRADIIGAKAGYKFQVSYEGSNFTVELYEYDPGSLNDVAKAALKQAESQGSITVAGTDIPGAFVSDNGKYLMLYTDANTDELHAARKKAVVAFFRAFP